MNGTGTGNTPDCNRDRLMDTDLFVVTDIIPAYRLGHVRSHLIILIIKIIKDLYRVITRLGESF